MRWQRLTQYQKVALRAEKQARWHLWFAWFPVKIYQKDDHAQWCWLERVGRRKVLTYKYVERGYRRDQLSLEEPEYCLKEDALVKRLEDADMRDDRPRIDEMF